MRKELSFGICQAFRYWLTAMALGLMAYTTTVHGGAPPVVDPATPGAELIRASDRDPLVGHVIAELDDPFRRVIERSDMPVDYFDGQIYKYATHLDVTDPARFTFAEPGVGFTVPAALRVWFSRRGRTYEGEPLGPDDENGRNVGAIVVRKLPIYETPEAVYSEVEAWSEPLRALGYEQLHLPKLKTRERFLAEAHKDFGEHLGSDYPSYAAAAWRQGHTGIILDIQRSPHPHKDGPEAHGYNVGIGIFDLRTSSYVFDALRNEDE